MSQQIYTNEHEDISKNLWIDQAKEKKGNV